MSPTIKPAPVQRSVTVKSGAAHAFKVFTEGFDRWWPRTHSIGKGKLAQAVLEPRVGGRWYGIDDDGSETDWGKVLVFEPPRRLVLAWQIGAGLSFDPTLITEVELRFTPDGPASTRVELEHRHLERMGTGAERVSGMVEGPNGWGLILTLFAASAESREQSNRTEASS